MKSNINVLLVEKYEDDADHIMERINSECTTSFNFTHIELLTDALTFLRKSNTQLVLLNLNLQDSSGLDTLRTFLEAMPSIPVVILSEREDKATCIETIQLGAQDYLFKDNITSDSLSRAIRHAITSHSDRESLETYKQQILQTSIDALTAITAAVDHDGNILTVNRAFREFILNNEVGFKEADASPNSLELFDQIFHKNPEDAASFAAGIHSVLGGLKDIFEMEYSCKSLRLSQLWFHCRAVAVPGAEPIVIVTHEDITIRKLAEKSSEINDKRFDLLIDTSPNCIFITDHKGCYTLVNKALATLYGISKSEIIGKTNAELSCNYLKEIKSPVTSLDKRDGENGPPKLSVSVDSVFTLPNGSVKWFCNFKKPIIFPGATECTINIAMDVTEQCKAQDALFNAELRLRTILDAQLSRVILLDPERRVLWPNTKACEEAGLSRSEVIGRHCQVIWGKSSPPCEVCPVVQAMEDGKPHSKQKITPEGKTFRVHGVPVRDDMGRIVSAVEVVEEITERVTLEGQLRQAQKMESLGTLAGGIAHDFNNILSGILGYTELAIEKSRKIPAVTNYLSEVYQAGLRATELTRQILTFSRRGDTELSPLRIEPIMREALKLLRSTLPTSIEIEVNIEENVQQIHADATQIHQIIMNLCTNASHAMELKGGTLGVNLTQVEFMHSTVSMTNKLVQGQYLQLSISDTGTGMSPEMIGMIFDPYFTTKDLGEGTGLGLSVIHGIVNEYGGAISVDSIPGEGSTFNLFLPTVQAASQESVEFTPEPLPKGNEKILVVDDEPTILKLYKRTLKQLGYHVTTENNSVCAVEIFRKDPGAFDLVLSDVTMPKLTGDQLAKEILAIRPDIPVVLCTGYSRMVSEESAKAIGVDALLIKPVVKRLLVTEIRRALDQRQEAKR